MNQTPSRENRNALRVLVISTNSDEAGAPRHVETIVNGLEFYCRFVLIFGEDGPVSDRLARRGHIVHIVKEMRTAISPARDLFALFKILHIVHKHDPDIIHCHSAKAGMLGRLSAFLTRKIWIYTVHGWGWRGVSRATKICIVLVEKALSKLPRGHYIFVAEAVMEEAIKIIGIDRRMGSVIFNGVGKIEAGPPPEDAPLTILMPARVSSAKDHTTMVVAFERFNSADSQLLLCGAGTDAAEFIAQVRNLAPKTFSRISFLGQRSDIAQIYSRCHVMALISHFEALPLSIIEAMSCARSIIATKIGGIPELITDGFNGILVEPGHTEHVEKALRRYRDAHTRLTYGANAKLTYEKQFTSEAMLSTLAQTYRRQELANR